MKSTTEKSALNLPTAIALIKESDLPQVEASSSLEIPQSSASAMKTGQKSHNIPQEDETANVAFIHSASTVPEDKHTYNHTTIIMSPEDVKSQALAKEIIDEDKSLADILDPDFKMKTTMDIMGGLFMRSPSALRENNRKQMKDQMMSDGVSSAHNGK